MSFPRACRFPDDQLPLRSKGSPKQSPKKEEAPTQVRAKKARTEATEDKGITTGISEIQQQAIKLWTTNITGISEIQKETIKVWTTNEGCHDIQQYRRGHDLSREQQDKQAELAKMDNVLMSALTQLPSATGVSTLQRGMASWPGTGTGFASYVEVGYLAWSAGAPVRQAILCVCPKNYQHAHGADISQFSTKQTEMEVLFPPNVLVQPMEVYARSSCDASDSIVNSLKLGLGDACWDKIVKTMRPSLWEPSDMDSVTHVVVVKLVSRQNFHELSAHDGPTGSGLSRLRRPCGATCVWIATLCSPVTASAGSSIFLQLCLPFPGSWTWTTTSFFCKVILDRACRPCFQKTRQARASLPSARIPGTYSVCGDTTAELTGVKDWRMTVGSSTNVSVRGALPMRAMIVSLPCRMPSKPEIWLQPRTCATCKHFPGRSGVPPRPMKPTSRDKPYRVQGTGVLQPWPILCVLS